MPDSVVDADTINTFKSRLDKHWLDQDVLYNFLLRINWNREVGSIAEWLACWTQAQKGPTLSGNSFRQTVHTHRASVHQAAKLAAALLRPGGK